MVLTSEKTCSLEYLLLQSDLGLLRILVVLPDIVRRVHENVRRG